MLKRVFTPKESRNFQIRADEADSSALFAHAPEFNAPAHGVWNIVHVGMLVPHSHQIYVCSPNCMRGVVLTAAEMSQSGRFSMVLLKEGDLTAGLAEQVTIEGVTQVLRKLPALPPVVMVFTVCTHRFLACDLDYIYRILSQRFPSVCFLRCFMEPITQKEGLSPDQRLRKTMFDPLQALPVCENRVAILGSDLPLDEDSDLRRMLDAGGYELMEIQNCHTYEEYLQMGSAARFLSIFPRAQYGADLTAQRLGRPHLFLPSSFSYEEIRAQETTLAEDLGLMLPDFASEERACEEALAAAALVIKDTPIVLDYTAHPRPLGLARLLISHGFLVTRVYLNAIDSPERADAQWLAQEAPSLLYCSVLRPERRVLARGSDDPSQKQPPAGTLDPAPVRVLAIGQIAAWCEDTPHFVNLAEGGGLWGYAGIRSMAALLTQAYLTKKDTRDLVVRKGWGCESCI